MGEAATTAPNIAGQENTPNGDIPILAVLPEISRSRKGDPKVDTKPVFDLALELVLNEIVLQARLTTNATGAVLALARSGELICRGTTGATAPDVAVCLRAKAGIAATCFETGEVRRVDDLGPDPNADAVIYRQNGVRSILVVPVQGEKGPILGILEIFSPRANAFCDRDVLTLQALTRRITTNIELVQQSGVQQNPVTQGTLLNMRLRNTAHSAQQAPDATAAQNVRRAHIKLQPPKFVAGILAQRAKLASVDWISVLAKSAIGLVLIAGGMSARSCWQHGSGDTKFVQLIREQMLQQPKQAEPVVNPIASSPAPIITTQLANPSTWPGRTSSHPETSSSITIQRQPIHKSGPAQVAVDEPAAKTDPSGNVVLFENHKTVSKAHPALESKSSSKDPAAGVLPNPTATGSAGVEIISTQAAMARLVQRVEPEYPNAARQQHIQGTVLLDVIVDATGAVETLSLVSGESQLMAAAELAVKQWRFQPLTKNGEAKKFESRITIDFTLAIEGSSGNH